MMAPATGIFGALYCRPLVMDVQAQVADYYHIPIGEMVSQRRSRSVARPRQVAMYLSRAFTPQSLPEIGRRFGNRDHTTVIHAIRMVERLREADSDFDNDVRQITARVTALSA